MKHAGWLAASFALVLPLTACAQGSAGEPVCAMPERLGGLPSELAESSGIAASRHHAGVFWTHNDSGGEPVVFAIDSTGRLLGEVRVSGASNVDWEDIALGPCPAGDCLYIADTGDNRERRDDVVIYRVPEPAPDASGTATAERFAIRYPEGPQDAEALFVLASGDVFVVSKGRSRPVTVYRYAAPLRPDERVELESRQELTEAPAPVPAQVTGAGATSDGRWVAVRNYVAAQLYRVTPDGLVGGLDPPGVGLLALGEPQGEGVDLRDDGSLVLTSESGRAGASGPVSVVRCTLP